MSRIEEHIEKGETMPQPLNHPQSLEPLPDAWLPLAAPAPLPTPSVPVVASAALAVPAPAPWPTGQPGTVPIVVPPPAAPTAPQPAPTVTISNNTVLVLGSPPNGPGFATRALWFVFVGWWLSGLVIVLGYAAALTVVGLPLAFWLFNRVPQAQTLRPRTLNWQVTTADGTTLVQQAHVAQRPWWARALWFVLVGWWLGAIWLTVAWVLSLLILPLPLSIVMVDRTPGIMTLQRH